MTCLLAFAAIGSVEIARLANGIPVLYERDSGAATVSIAAVVRTDGLTPHELDSVESLVDSWHGGTESLTLHRLNALAAQSGGRITVALAADCVRFDATVPRESFPLVITLLSELFLRPQITVDTIGEGREQRRRALPISEHPLERGVRALLHEAGLFGTGTPSAQPQAVEAAWREAFRPENMAIGVVGDVPLEQVVQRIGASLGSWQPPRPIRGRRSPPSEAAPAPEARHPVVGVLLAGPAPDDARFPAFLVGLTALLDGKGSIVGREVRYARSLAYEMGALRFVRAGRVWVLFYLGTDEEEVLGEVLTLVRSGVERMTEDELERGKSYLLSGLRYRGGGASLFSFLSGSAAEPIERAHRYAWLQAFGFRGAPDGGLERAIGLVTVEEARAVMGLAVRDARALRAVGDTQVAFGRQRSNRR